ncbi:MAG: U32 family peptidase [Alistipes sp.]
MKQIELLAPAKDLASAIAAVDYGADAVYIGGAKFGARSAAGNATDEIAQVVEYAHQYGARVYVTLNTLLFDEELAAAELQARELIAAGVDALIVQDMALRQMDLPVELHASTQMSNRTPEQVQFLEQCGFSRVILERALSLDEIRAICATTQAEVECFVHGAICVGYSGRCFLSRSISNRSGNRGACSQPCRLTYDLTDADRRVFIKSRHLLSVQDLNLSERIGELLDAGVTSLKIEGRLKDEGYIKNIVSYYRQEVDRAIASREGFVRSSVGESVTDFTPDPAKSFTRGESEYFFSGKHAGVASFDTPKSVGERIGRVVKTDAQSFLLDRDHPLTAGDGICFGALGTNVNRVEGRRIVPNKMDGIEFGTEIYRNYDHLFRQMLEHSRTRRTIAVTATTKVTNEGICVRYTDCEGVMAEVSRSGDFEQAKNPEKMAETLRTQLAKSGDTLFAVRTVKTVGTAWFVPISLLGELRREGLEQLRRARLARPMTHKILAEDPAAHYPMTQITAEENVTNRLSEAFYKDHEVQTIARGLDLSASTVGHRVMQSAYCLRREIGECLLENPTLQGELYLERGFSRYRLSFDCTRCEMSLIHERDDKENYE